jgi:hypothetical protein
VFLLALLIIALMPNFDISDGGKYEGPGGALIHYLDASYNLKLDVAYQRISSQDKSMLTLSKFINQRKGMRAHGGFFRSTYSYQIISLHIDESTAEVEIVIRRSSFLNKLSKFFDFVLEAIIGAEKYRTPEAHIGFQKRAETPLRASVKKFKLLKENEGWKVFLGLRKKVKQLSPVKF